MTIITIIIFYFNIFKLPSKFKVDYEVEELNCHQKNLMDWRDPINGEMNTALRLKMQQLTQLGESVEFIANLKQIEDFLVYIYRGIFRTILSVYCE